MATLICWLVRARWRPEWPVGPLVSMRHFRPNLVIAGSGPYEEDDWTVIRIGLVVFDVAAMHPLRADYGRPGHRPTAADQEPLATLDAHPPV